MSVLYFPGVTFLCAGESRKLGELYHKFSVRSISEIILHGNLHYITVSQFGRRCSGVQKSAKISFQHSGAFLRKKGIFALRSAEMKF